MTADPTIERMTAFLNKQLERGDGKFCIENTTFPVSEWGVTMFRKFLKSNIQKGILTSEKDDIGRVWYKKK